MNARARAAVHEHGDVAEALPARGVQDVRIARVHVDFGDAGVGVVLGRVAEAVTEDLLPVLAAVGGAVQAALAAGGPHGPLGRHEHDVGVAWIDGDHADVLARLEPHVLPARAAVAAAIDARAEAEVAAGGVLAGAEPDRVRVARIERDAADGIGILLVEDRRPGGAGILGLPDVAAADADVPDVRVVGVHGDVGDAAGHQCRADGAHLEPGEGAFVEARSVGLLGGARGAGGGDQQGQQHGCRQEHGTHLRVSPPFETGRHGSCWGSVCGARERSARARRAAWGHRGCIRRLRGGSCAAYMRRVTATRSCFMLFLRPSWSPSKCVPWLLATLLGAGTVVRAAEGEAPPSIDTSGVVEEVVVTAMRRAATLGDLDRTGAVRSVEAPARIETVTDLLRHAPGTFFQQTTPGQSTPILRGLRGSQVLHLVDGMRLNNALFRDAPTQYLALVPVEGLEAVEVLSGAAPALYGADALGGVVAVRSRMPEFAAQGLEIGGRASAGWSSADLRRTATLAADLRGERAAASFGVADRSFGNRRTADGDRISATGYQAHSAFLNGQLALAPDQRLELSGQWAEQPSTPRVDELVAGFGQAAPASERFLFRPNGRAMVRLGWRWQSASRPARALRADLARQRITDDRLTRDRGADSTTLENNRSTLDGLVLQFNDAQAGLGNLVAGVELYSDRVDSARSALGDDGSLSVQTPRFGDGARMRSASAFLIPEWTPAWGADEALAITLGLRASAWEIEVPAAPGLSRVDLTRAS